MYWLFLSLCFVMGLIAIPLLTWLIFVAPYGEHRWLPLWVYLAGFLIGSLPVVAFCLFMGRNWTRD